jgi:hypothetical protein
VTDIHQLAMTDKHHHQEHFAIPSLVKMAKTQGRLTGKMSRNIKSKGSFLRHALDTHSWTLSCHQNRRASAGLPLPSES